MTSVTFQSEGNVDVRRDQLMISVRGPSTTCRQTVITLALTLSGPGALFNGSDLPLCPPPLVLQSTPL